MVKGILNGVTDVIYFMETKNRTYSETGKNHLKRVLAFRNELDSKIFLSMET
jgi:hypothetical protein